MHFAQVVAQARQAALQRVAARRRRRAFDETQGMAIVEKAMGAFTAALHGDCLGCGPGEGSGEGSVGSRPLRRGSHTGAQHKALSIMCGVIEDSVRAFDAKSSGVERHAELAAEVESSLSPYEAARKANIHRNELVIAALNASPAAASSLLQNLY